MVAIQKPFLIIAEDKLSASIVRSLIDVGNNKVYVVVAGNYQNIPSLIRTYQINYNGKFDYIAIFNANSDDDFDREEKISMIRFLCNVEKSQENIGIFWFRDNIETELHLPQLNTANMAEITGALRKDAAEMKQSPTIVEIQKFVDTLTKKIK